jgi:hypothetical protein
MMVLQDKQQRPILKINPEYEKRIVQVSNKEYEKFKQSIKEDGMHYAIAVNQDYVILDGHHRYRVSKELGINPKIRVFRFDNKLLERKLVITSNLKRRHLTDKQKLFYCEELEQIYAALKKQKQEQKPKQASTTLRNPALYTSKSTEYRTPKEFYQSLYNEFHFILDPCTTKDNPLNTPIYFTKEDDGLTQEWNYSVIDDKGVKRNSVFVNPPYGSKKNIGYNWVKKRTSNTENMI